jgi:hypothetical protein
MLIVIGPRIAAGAVEDHQRDDERCVRGSYYGHTPHRRSNENEAHPGKAASTPASGINADQTCWEIPCLKFALVCTAEITGDARSAIRKRQFLCDSKVMPKR